MPNAAAAAAMAAAAGIGCDEVVDGAAVAPARCRRGGWSCTSAPTALVVVNDAYNANPASMRAALDALAAIGARGGRRTVAVLGEMLELGDSSTAAHTEVGEHVARLGIDVVVTVGEAR